MFDLFHADGTSVSSPWNKAFAEVFISNVRGFVIEACRLLPDGGGSYAGTRRQ